jgi:hypothetical protein
MEQSEAEREKFNMEFNQQRDEINHNMNLSPEEAKKEEDEKKKRKEEDESFKKQSESI